MLARSNFVSVCTVLPENIYRASLFPHVAMLHLYFKMYHILFFSSKFYTQYPIMITHIFVLKYSDPFLWHSKLGSGASCYHWSSLRCCGKKNQVNFGIRLSHDRIWKKWSIGNPFRIHCTVALGYTEKCGWTSSYNTVSPNIFHNHPYAVFILFLYFALHRMKQGLQNWLFFYISGKSEGVGGQDA